MKTNGFAAVAHGRPMENTKLDPAPDGFWVRLRYGKGLRGRFLIRVADEAEAGVRAVRLQELAAMLGSAGHSAEAPIVLEEAAGATSAKDFAEAIRFAEDLCAGKGSPRKPSAAKRAPRVTFRVFATRWTDGTLAREHPDHVAPKKTRKLDGSRLNAICDVRIAPGLVFGALPLEGVTLEHCQTVMRNLPDTAKRSATRRHYAQLIHRVLELAVFPCRLLAANPLPRGFMPKIGRAPAFPYLYPSEDAALLRCSSIPLGRRMLWGLLAREGCRSGEAVALQFGLDVDLEIGSCSLDSNKTDDARTWALDAGVSRALRHYAKLRGASTGDALFVDGGAQLTNDGLAEQLRQDLEAAGVKRAELFEDGENTRKMRTHDLRGTFVTLSLANGRTETWVADRTGHQSSVMINRYRRAARSASELGLGPLLPLDIAIPETCAITLGAMVEGLQALCRGPATLGQRVGQSAVSMARRNEKSSRFDAVSRDGIEPPTRGFSERAEATSSDAEGTFPDEIDTGNDPEKHTGPGPAHPMGQNWPTLAHQLEPPPVTVDAAIDPIERALAEAVALAARAGQWTSVEVLSRELGERRRVRTAPGIPSIDDERARRDRKT